MFTLPGKSVSKGIALGKVIVFNNENKIVKIKIVKNELQKYFV